MAATAAMKVLPTTTSSTSSKECGIYSATIRTQQLNEHALFLQKKESQKLRVTTTTTANEDELAAACERDGVASIAIDASNWSFQLYTSGIYNELACNAHKLNHAALLGRFRFGKRCKILDR